MVEQNTELIEFFLVGSLDDANSDVRAQSRDCFMLYKEKCPDEAILLLHHGIKAQHVKK